MRTAPDIAALDTMIAAPMGKYPPSKDLVRFVGDDVVKLEEGQAAALAETNRQCDRAAELFRKGLERVMAIREKVNASSQGVSGEDHCEQAVADDARNEDDEEATPVKKEPDAVGSIAQEDVRGKASKKPVETTTEYELDGDIIVKKQSGIFTSTTRYSADRNTMKELMAHAKLSDPGNFEETAAASQEFAGLHDHLFYQAGRQSPFGAWYGKK